MLARIKKLLPSTRILVNTCLASLATTQCVYLFFIAIGLIRQSSDSAFWTSVIVVSLLNFLGLWIASVCFLHVKSISASRFIGQPSAVALAMLSMCFALLISSTLLLRSYVLADVALSSSWTSPIEIQRLAVQASTLGIYWIAGVAFTVAIFQMCGKLIFAVIADKPAVGECHEMDR